jgi:uncharacterized protein YraI
MRTAVIGFLVLGFSAACSETAPVASLGVDRMQVAGVEEGDMLKLRGGPGLGFETYAGLPNGTILRVRNCRQVGGTRWCEVALDRAPGLGGFVSETYLRPLG